MMNAGSYAVSWVFRSLSEGWSKHEPDEAGRRDRCGALGPPAEHSEPRDGPRRLDYLVESTRYA
jgi:hypothetical protein